jgi:hypothetical protein
MRRPLTGTFTSVWPKPLEQHLTDITVFRLMELL